MVHLVLVHLDLVVGDPSQITTTNIFVSKSLITVIPALKSLQGGSRALASPIHFLFPPGTPGKEDSTAARLLDPDALLPGLFRDTEPEVSTQSRSCETNMATGQTCFTLSVTSMSGTG